MPPPGEPLRVLVKSPYSIYSGYGNDGYGLLRALHQWGCDVYPQPTWVDVPVPPDLLPLFGKTLTPPFDLIINHWYPGGIEIQRESRACTRVAVAMTMWEFSAPAPGARRPCPAHLAAGQERGEHGVMGSPDCPKCRPPVPSGFAGFGSEPVKNLRKRLQWFDMVLGYDEVSLAALAPYLPPKVAGGVLQGGFAASDWKPAERDWHDPNFGFLMHGQLGSRKQPWLAIQAFQKLKFEKPGPYPDGFDEARLTLHTNTPGQLFPELNGPFAPSRIRVICEALSKPDLDQLYAANHVLLAPSRGEGKNLPGLEFSATGGVPCLTDYGGHRQWAGGDWAYLLDYQLEPTFGARPWAARDARVSQDHLAETIWHIWTHRAEAQRKGQLAAEIVPKTCDWSVVVEALFRKVRDTVTSNNVGPQVYDKAMACRRQPDREPAGQGGSVFGTRNWPGA